jgi:hypothetical protein
VTTRSVPATTVTIGGTAYPLAQPISAVDALAPEVDRASVQIPLGRVRHEGAWITSEPSINLGDAIEITCGSYVWSGEVSALHESGSARRRTLNIDAVGLSGLLERAYPYRHKVGSAWVDGFPDFNFGNRGNKSGSLAFGGTARWTQATAVEALLTWAADLTHGSGLPTIALAGDTAGLTVSDTWPVFGSSVHAALMGIISNRGRLGWRAHRPAGTPTITVYALTGAGTALDLTLPFITDYGFSRDGSSTVAALVAMGQRKRYVQTYLAYPGGSGDFDGQWSTSDVTRLDDKIAALMGPPDNLAADVAAETAAGTEGGPAFRHFALTTGALPDGTDRINGQLIGGLPCAGSGSVWTSGGGPWLVFLKEWDATSSSYLWRSVPVSVQVLGQNRIWIDGPGWVRRFRAADRAAITCQVESRGMVEDIQTGGAGTGIALLASGAGRVIASSDAALAASAAGTLLTDGITVQDDTSELAETLADRWTQLGALQRRLTWSEAGIASTDLAPGARIASVKLPRYPTAETLTLGGMFVARRQVSWRGRTPSTTWSAEPPLLAESAQAR